MFENAKDQLEKINSSIVDVIWEEAQSKSDLNNIPNREWARRVNVEIMRMLAPELRGDFVEGKDNITEADITNYYKTTGDDCDCIVCKNGKKVNLGYYIDTDRMNKYKAKKTQLPMIVIIAFCKNLGISLETLLDKAYLKQGFPLKWEGLKSHNASSEKNYSLHERFAKAILDLEEGAGHFRQEFMRCIKRRALDSKYCYFGDEVTQKFLNIQQSAEYLLYKKSTELLESSLQHIVNIVKVEEKPIRVICLGIGDGSKDAIILNKILAKTKGTIDYYVFDISDSMIKIGSNNVRKSLSDSDRERVKIQLFQMDFMQINWFQDLLSDDKLNLYLLLGNTLGNFVEGDLLDKIHSVMHRNDFLLIDNQLKKDGQLTVEEENKLKKIYDTKKEKEYVHAILKRAGLSSNDGDVETDHSYEYEIHNHDLKKDFNCITIKQNFVMKHKKNIFIDGESVTFAKKDVITVYYSKKYTKTALKNLLSEEHFLINDDFCFYSENEEYALILCKKE